MKTASWVIASAGRPEFLKHCLQCIGAQAVPYGWRQEVVVCTPYGEYANHPRCINVHEEKNVGLQYTKAFNESSGELILVTGDDDMHAPNRLWQAVKAYEQGAVFSGFSPMHFVDTQSGTLVKWVGPAHRCGATMNYRRTALHRCEGWGECTKNSDRQLHERLASSGLPASLTVKLSGLSKSTAFLHHEGATSKNRPFFQGNKWINRRKVRHGDFMVHRAGHWQDREWPPMVQAALETLCAKASTSASRT